MDNAQDKRRMTISYILAAIFLVIVVIGSHLYTNYRIQQRQAAAGETAEEEPAQMEEAEEEEEDSSYEQITVDYSIYETYRYRTVTDTAELSALGLPATVSDEDLGGKFATADNQIVLYAYPRYGCRAVLIGNNTNKYSFCVLDSFTDNTQFGTLAQIPGLYGISGASAVKEAKLIRSDSTSVTIDGATQEQMLTAFAECVNNNAKTTVPNGSRIVFTANSGLSMTLACDQNCAIISVLGESYKVSDGLKTMLQGMLG